MTDRAAVLERHGRAYGELRLAIGWTVGLEGFPANSRVKSGRSAVCWGCDRERKRRWREENQEYVEAYNLARRSGPFPTVCSVCGETFDAVHPMQHRCPPCQRKHLCARPGPSTRAKAARED